MLKAPVAELWVTARAGGGQWRTAGGNASRAASEYDRWRSEHRAKEAASMMYFYSNVTQPVLEDEGDPVQMAQQSTGVRLYLKCIYTVHGFMLYLDVRCLWCLTSSMIDLFVLCNNAKTPDSAVISDRQLI